MNNHQWLLSTNIVSALDYELCLLILQNFIWPNNIRVIQNHITSFAVPEASGGFNDQYKPMVVSPQLSWSQEDLLCLTQKWSRPTEEHCEWNAMLQGGMKNLNCGINCELKCLRSHAGDGSSLLNILVNVVQHMLHLIWKYIFGSWWGSTFLSRFHFFVDRLSINNNSVSAHVPCKVAFAKLDWFFP